MSSELISKFRMQANQGLYDCDLSNSDLLKCLLLYFGIEFFGSSMCFVFVSGLCLVN